MQTDFLTLPGLDSPESKIVGENYMRLITGFQVGDEIKYHVLLRVEHLSETRADEPEIVANVPLIGDMTRADVDHLKLQVDNVLGFAVVVDVPSVEGDLILELIDKMGDLDASEAPWAEPAAAWIKQWWFGISEGEQ